MAYSIWGIAWDRNGAIQAFKDAGILNEILHRTPAASRTPEQYLRVIHKYQEVLLKDPHYGGSDDSLLFIGRLYQELTERTGRSEHAHLALDAYVRLADQYPASPFRAEALLAAGQVSFELLKNTSEAARHYQRTNALFPGTLQAKVAQQKLALMGMPAAQTGTNPAGSSFQRNGKLPSLPQPRPSKPNSTGNRNLTRILGLKAGRVVIDPGHGGHDTGTQSKTGFKEKDLALDLALRLKPLIEQDLGIEVILTRATDVFVPLEERTRIANQHKADIFLSIHANFSSQGRTSGVETYVLDFARSASERELAARENASSHRTIGELEDLVRTIVQRERLQESRELASRIQKRLQAEMRKKNPASKNRGIKQAPFVVLAGASMPSILTEVAFLSNQRDAATLFQPKSRQEVAAALLAGISEYIDTLSLEASLAQKNAAR